MAHNDGGGGGAGEKPTVAWSRASASAGGRAKRGQAGEVVGRAHQLQLANGQLAIGDEIRQLSPTLLE